MSDNMEEGLMGMLRRLVGDEETETPIIEERFISKLSPSEIEERASIGAEKHRIVDQLQKIMVEKEAIDHRSQLWWYNVRKARKIEVAGHVQLKNGDEVFVMIHQ